VILSEPFRSQTRKLKALGIVHNLQGTGNPYMKRL